MSATPTRSAAPTLRRTSDSVYSNFDHELDEAIVAELEAEPGKVIAQHAAWDFCGMVWTEDGRWFEEVWQFHVPVEVLEGDSARDVIEQANAKYGAD